MKFRDCLISENRRIIDTKHSIERAYDSNRFGKKIRDEYGSIESFRKEVNNVIKNAVRKIVKKHNDKTGTYGIHSKSTGIGAIIDWREDYKNNDNKNHAIIVTMLPIKKQGHHFKPRDTKVVVEKQIQMLIESMDVKILEGDGQYDRVDLTEGKHAVENAVHFMDGEIYDYGINEYILVD